MTIVASILGVALTCAIAFVLTFGTARYGPSGTVVGLVGLVPLVGLQRIASRNGRVRPLGGFATTLGLVAVSALALTVAVVVGVPDLGRLDYALLGAAILSVLWLHAVRRGHFFWGALAGVGIAAGGAAFTAMWFQTGLSDPQAAADAWWRSGWEAVAVAGVVCGGVGVVVRWASRRATAVGELPSPGSLAQRVASGRDGEQRIREMGANSDSLTHH